MSEEVKNWFESLNEQANELRFIDGYYSINDVMKDLFANQETAEIVKELLSVAFGKLTSQASSNPMVNNISLSVLLSHGKIPQKAKIALNEKLIKIKK